MCETDSSALFGRLIAASKTAKTSNTYKHAARQSLLSSDQIYQPLTGHSSFSSQRPPIYSPAGQEAAYEAGGYHDREGLPTRELLTSNQSKRNSIRKMYIPNTPWTWAFMGVALAQAVIGVALESYVFAEFQIHLNHHADGDSNFSSQNVPVSRTIPTFLALYIFGFIYEIVLVWDALRLKNTIQVIGVCIYNVGMLIYASVEADQVHEAIRKLAGGQYAVNIDPSVWASLRPFLIAAPCVIALGTALLCVGAWKLYDEFAWTIYKHISADLALRRRFLQYQVRNTASLLSFIVF